MRPAFRLALALLALSVAPAHAEEWRHLVAPYVWGSSLDADVNIRGNEVDPDSDDGIMDNLEFAGMLRYEGHGEKAGILFDALYVAFGFPSEDTPAELDLSGTVLELAGSWHAHERFELLFGARYINISVDVDFDVLADVDEDDSFLDGLVGFRGQVPVGEKWKWYFRGDVAAGGTEFTWNAETAFLWAPNDTFSLALGWRALDTSLEKDATPADSEIEALLNGPIVGFVFHF